jgi:hypothetical protein
VSDQPARSQTDLDAILAGIERDLAEAGKLRRDSEKFIAEQRKLISEASKLDRDRWFAPWLAIAGLIGGLVSIATLILHALGKV